MSYNVFVNGSIFNYGSKGHHILRQEMEKIKKPQYEFDEDGLTIKEDFDMRHIDAVKKAIDRIWREIHVPQNIGFSYPYENSEEIFDEFLQCIKCFAYRTKEGRIDFSKKYLSETLVRTLIGGDSDKHYDKIYEVFDSLKEK